MFEPFGPPYFSLPWEIITPGEDYHLSLPRELLGLLHQCVEKSDLLSIFGLLHLLPPPPQTFWSSSMLLAKELWVASIKSQVESGCYSLFQIDFFVNLTEHLPLLHQGMQPLSVPYKFLISDNETCRSLSSLLVSKAVGPAGNIPKRLLRTLNPSWLL